MVNKRALSYLICREWEGFQGRVEIGNTVLCEEADEVQASNGVFSFRRREHRTVWGSLGCQMQ